MRVRMRRVVALLLCCHLLAPTLPSAAEEPSPAADEVFTAGDWLEEQESMKDACPKRSWKRETPSWNCLEVKKDWYLSAEIGQPSVWSLAQAHYLLSEVHSASRDLQTKLPDVTALDPNRANAARLEILRTLLGLEAQFDESVGAKNRIEMETFEDRKHRRDQARAELPAQEAELRQVERELLDLQQQRLGLKTEDEIADAARGTGPLTEADRRRKARIADLDLRITQKTEQKKRLEDRIASLRNVAEGDIETPGLTTSGPGTSTTDTIGAFPAATALQDFAKKFVDEAGTPSLAASIALDNYLGMQYEIVAKQLTLLRDEVGPEERVIFLELPTSIYTVDQWANNHVVRVEWAVTRFFDRVNPKVYNAVTKETLLRDQSGSRKKSGKPSEEQEFPVTLDMVVRSAKQNKAYGTWVRMPDFVEPKASQESKNERKGTQVEEGQAAPTTEERTEESRINADQSKETQAKQSRAEVSLFKLRGGAVEGERVGEGKLGADEAKEDQKKGHRGIKITKAYEAAESLDDKGAAKESQVDGSSDMSQAKMCGSPDLARECIRALEVIPRQSALNVNEHHASTRNVGILGFFKWLSGFGAKINYQRQRENYEKFLQQEAFASGFGKGRSRFGWVFGPLPGSNRISPGQRTTYAVLAVPRDALAIELEAVGWAFRRKVAPGLGEVVGKSKFIVRVPGEQTERLWVESVSYTPAEAGKGSATGVVRGRYFSPQLGVLVNGIPLKRVQSITRVGSKEEARSARGGIEGEFEVPNSREMVFSLAMPAGYVGTPVITLVTPERSTDINFFPLEVNFGRRQSLLEASELQPMFTESFKLEEKLEKVDAARFGCSLPDSAKGMVVYRLLGAGLRPKGEIWVGDQLLDRVANTAGFQKKCQVGTGGFALQESTRSYLLAFKPPEKGNRWKLRYRQPNRQGFDERLFEHQLPAEAEFKHAIRHYRFHAKEKRAELALTLSIPDTLRKDTTPIVCPEVAVEGSCYAPWMAGSSSAEAGCGVSQKDQDENYRITCVVNAERDGTERELVSLRILSTLQQETAPDKKSGTSSDSASGIQVLRAEDPPVEKVSPSEKVRFLDIRIPVRPRVTSVADRTSGLPEGRSTDQAFAYLTGVNLTRVTGVLFGDQAAQLTQEVSSELLAVKVPKLDVPDGERRTVPVTIQTDAGALATGFHYTYIGPDPPKKEEKKGDSAQ